MKRLLRIAAPHLLSIAAMLVLAVLYFLPQLQGMVVSQTDVQQYRGMTQEIIEVQEETGTKPLWTNAMFGGMPGYQINTPNKGNYLSVLDRILRLGINHPIGRFLVAMLCFYILMIAMGVSPWLSLIGAAAFGFTTNNISLYETGHITKLRAISYFPLIAAGMVLAYRDRLLWGGILFAVGLGLNLLANHVQMTYYLFLTLPFFVAAVAIKEYRSKEFPAFIRASLVLVVAGVLAIASSTTNLWTTYEYSQSTMRGAPILEPEDEQPQAQIASSSETEGLSWDYAMQWSNGALDLLSSFIPGAVGGGSGEKLDADDATYQFLRRQNINPEGFRAPFYWGALPFTSGPIYFGALMFMLFIMGLVLIKGPLRWWVGLGVLLTFLLSLGKNLEFFNSFFYYYVPLYNKFRTPNSVLAIASFLIPVLGMAAMHKLVLKKSSDKEIMRSLAIGGGITGGLALILWMLGPSLFSFQSPGDARLEQAGWDVQAIIADRKSLLRQDALRTFLLVAAGAALIWAYIKGHLKRAWLVAALGILVIGDLWLVDRRYLDNSSFQPERTNDAFFQPRPVDEQILQDTDPNYRVFDITAGSPFESAQYAYFHKMIGGYHAAKLQRYQDIIDRHLSRGNQAVLDMLNTKYIIRPGNDQQAVAQRNPGALGNAWLVDSLVFVSTPNAEINALNDFDPGRTAIVNETFRPQLEGLDPDPSGSIELVDYRPDDLAYASNTQGEALAVFSEVWYDKGWQAYIDGEPVPHIRVNYILRALRLPPGEHDIRFVFEPRSFYTGRIISRLSSSFMLAGLLGIIAFSLYQSRDKLKSEPEPEPAPAKRKAPATPKRRRKKK